MPSNFMRFEEATFCASSSAGWPFSIPCLLRPAYTDTNILRRAFSASAACSIQSTTKGSSTTKLNVGSFLDRATARSIAFRLAGCLVHITFFRPAPDINSASAMVAQVSPIAPCAIWSLATSTLL